MQKFTHLQITLCPICSVYAVDTQIYRKHAERPLKTVFYSAMLNWHPMLKLECQSVHVSLIVVTADRQTNRTSLAEVEKLACTRLYYADNVTRRNTFLKFLSLHKQ